MAQMATFDPVWENDVYAEGRHLNRWPFDMVVSFVFRHAPRDRPRSAVRILEVGCGAGNNLLFAAREGFSVAGLDGSRSALDYARRRFAEEGLEADLRVGDFTSLPFPDGTFDLAVDRGAITCCGRTAATRALAEIRRVLADGGKFLFNPYSDRHSSHVSGRPGPDGVTQDITGGTLVGVGPLCFYGREPVRVLFHDGWKVESMEHLEIRQELECARGLHAEWRVVAQKAALSVRS
jgi:SAM-dependent methyltransferase